MTSRDICSTGSCSKAMISEMMEELIVQMVRVVIFMGAWVRSAVDFVDKCFAFLPRGPAGSLGGVADFDVIGGSSFVGCVPEPSPAAEKIRKALKLKRVHGRHHENLSQNSDSLRVDDESLSNMSITRTTWAAEDDDDGLICAVCLVEIAGRYPNSEEVYELPRCDHIFHKFCVEGWLAEKHSDCPLCRSSLIPLTAAARSETGVEAATDELQQNNDTGQVLPQMRGEEFGEPDQAAEAETAATAIATAPSNWVALGSLWWNGPSRTPTMNFRFSHNWTQTLMRLEGFSS